MGVIASQGGERTMRCEKVQPILNRLVDSELDRWSAWRVSRHLADCGACAAEYRQIEAVGAAARCWRRVAMPPHLQSRLAAIAAERACSASRADGSGRSVRVSERTRQRMGRLGLAAMAVALLAVFWSQSQRSTPVLAAVIRATETAPAVHMIGVGSRGSRVEMWWVDKVGYFMRARRENDEQVDVDNLKQRYSTRYGNAGFPSLPKRSRSGIRPWAGTSARLSSAGSKWTKSVLAELRWAAGQRDSLSSTGLLKQMARRHASTESQRYAGGSGRPPAAPPHCARRASHLLRGPED